MHDLVTLEKGQESGMTVATDEAVSTAMLVASIGFRVQPHKRDEALSAVDDTVQRMRTAPGCSRTRLVADTEDPNMFTVLSEWQTAASADSFFASREFQIFKGIRILLREEPVIVIDDVRSRVTRLLRSPTA
jgi:quinol monooxygenase YgiN